MKGKVFVAALIALVLGSCPCLASLASAAQAKAHACCPAGEQSSESDCCLRAPSPDAVTFTASPLVLVGVAASAPVPAVVLEAFRIDVASLSPPDTPPLRSPSSRAPPVLS